MADDTVVLLEDVWKGYRLGEIGIGSLSEDVTRRWALMRGRPDPALAVDDTDGATRGHRFWALKGLDLTVSRGEILGIIGRNGAGKSTLLKLLSRITTPTRGRIRARGRVASLLEVGTGFHPDLTGRENVFLNGAIMGMSRREIAARLPEIIAFSGCGPHVDTPVKRYSSGMVVRLGFSVAAHLECEILIVDEVLAVGDREFQDRCVAKMRSVASGEGRTVLFVSHNLATLRSLCGSGALIEEGRARRFPSIDAAIRQYAQMNRSTRSEVRYARNGNRPAITRIALDEEAIALGDFHLEIDFESDRAMVPIPGVTVYDENMNPVFGSNGRIHEIGGCREPLRAGTLRCELTRLPLHGGRFVVSVWLGDAYRDHDARESAIAFDFPAMASWTAQPLRSILGPMKVEPDWRLCRPAAVGEGS